MRWRAWVAGATDPGGLTLLPRTGGPCRWPAGDDRCRQGPRVGSMVGRPAPAFTLATLTGRCVPLDQSRGISPSWRGPWASSARTRPHASHRESPPGRNCPRARPYCPVCRHGSARAGLPGKMEGHGSMDISVTDGPLLCRLTQGRTWTAISHYSVMDVASLWTDRGLGFLIAGGVGAWIPRRVRAELFLAYHPGSPPFEVRSSDRSWPW
jgi:hypothetical protein